MMDQMRRVPGIADLRIQQTFDQPKLHVITDRTKAAESGYTQADVAQTLLISLSGSFQTQPTFWLNPQNGVSYSVVTQVPQYDVKSLQDLRNLPLTATQPTKPEILNDVTSITRGNGMAVVNHYDIQRTIDIFGSSDRQTSRQWAARWNASSTPIAVTSCAAQKWLSEDRWRLCASRSSG